MRWRAYLASEINFVDIDVLARLFGQHNKFCVYQCAYLESVINYEDIDVLIWKA